MINILYNSYGIWFLLKDLLEDLKDVMNAKEIKEGEFGIKFVE